MTPADRLEVTGHYAGPVTRAAGAALDIAIVLGLFTAGVAGLGLLLRVVFGASITEDPTGPISVIAMVMWAFVYVFTSLTVAGRTVGKAIVGLRVVNDDGTTLTVRHALWRTLAFPLSGLIFGLGFALILVDREHRALHDFIARTAVVYDWGDRPAELPGPLSEFVTRRAGAEYTTKAKPVPTTSGSGTPASHASETATLRQPSSAPSPPPSPTQPPSEQ